jgi:hypothetical protein
VRSKPPLTARGRARRGVTNLSRETEKSLSLSPSLSRRGEFYELLRLGRSSIAHAGPYAWVMQ